MGYCLEKEVGSTRVRYTLSMEYGTACNLTVHYRLKAHSYDQTCWKVDYL